MFDKLIESNTAAVQKPRRSYFVVSTVVVGILFVTAVVVSLYAQNIDLGVDAFDAAMLLAPVAAEAPEPPPPAAPQPRTPSAPTEVPRRQANMLRINEPPTDVPPPSVSQNTLLSRPLTDFSITSGPETNSIGSQGTNAGPASRGSTGTGSSAGSTPTAETEVVVTTPPPPVKKEVKPPVMKSEGVINGRATYLPAPPYPAPARAVGAEGTVDVQVTIDEQGKVISSHAVSGHPLLRQTAEKAAWSARFTPTYLSKVPVKVTGVIVYKFTRN